MKRLFKITGYFLGFIISSVVILAFLVDANMFKPRIAALALERGIALDMRGDLHWAFWPSLGLAVEDVSIASSETPTSPIAEIKKASFLMAFIPLMQSDFQVKHILVDGATINLAVNPEGKGNWEALTKSQQTAGKPDQPRHKQNSSVDSSDLHLSIAKISLQKSAINYIDERKGQRIQLSDIQLDMDDVNTESKPFAMDFSWLAIISDTAKGGSPAMTVKGKLTNSITLNQDFTLIDLADGELKLDVNAAASASIALQYALNISQINSNLEYKGKVSLPNVNAKKWLAAFASDLKTANEKALTDISLSSDIRGGKNQIALNNIKLQLDKTQFKGEIAVTNFATQAFNLNLQGDEINLDDYLAPQPAAAAPAAASAAPAADTPLPLALLRSLNLNSKIAFAKMQFSQLHLEKTQLDISAHNGTLKQELSTNAYSGSIHEKLTMNVQQTSADLQFETIVNGVQLEPLLKDKKLDKSLHLSGAIAANASGSARGGSSKTLMDSLNAKGNFAGAQVRLAPFNIEQQFCQIVNLINKTAEPQNTWNGYTELRELSGKITLANRLVTVESLDAGIEKLQLGTTGNINLASGTYDFRLPLKLIRDASDTDTSIATSAKGCTVTSNYWAERSMALLRCKGQYAEINPGKDCRPDKEMLNAVIKDFAEYKLREKHGAKLDAKKTELLKKLDEKLGGEGKAEQTKALLKNLFKKKNDQQNKTDEQ